MKIISKRNSFYQKLVVISVRAFVFIGFLFIVGSGLAQAPGFQGSPTNTPLASWSFQDPTNWTSDQGFAPISFTNLSFSYIGDGASLVVDTNVPAWLRYYVYEPTNAATNLTVDVGSVTFWFAPNWSSADDTNGGFGPQEYGRLFEVGSYTPESSYGLWSIYVNDGGTNIYFSAQTNDLSSNVTTYITYPISWTTNYFHFIALTYSATNTALYLDGVLATNGPGVTVYPGPDVLTNGFYLGSSSSGLNQAAGMFNTVATYNYPLNSNDVQTIFNWYYPTYIIDPYNAGYMGLYSSQNISSYGTNLALTPPSLSSNSAGIFIVNGTGDVLYEIQGATNLAHPNWTSEGFISGSELTNWTPTSVARKGRPSLFLRVRSWIDSQNVGIPDWWQLLYFGYVGINPYALSSSGDGFTIWQKYQNGLNPNSFETPPAPNNFAAVLSTNGADVLLSWNSAQGTVINYSIVRGVYDPGTGNYDYSTIATVNSNITSSTDAGAIQNGNDQYDVYEITADYPGGNTSGTAYSYIYTTPPPPSTPPTPIYNISVGANLVRNSTGRWQLMFSDLSANAQAIQLIWGNGATTTVLTSSLTNGIYQIPDTDSVNHLGDTISVQGLQTNGEAGTIVQVGTLANDAPYFVDGRQHLKQNLTFLIRGASMVGPFDSVEYSSDYLNRKLNQSTNFTEFGFLHHDWQYPFPTPVGPFAVLDDLWPFTANYELANYFMDTALTNGPLGNTNFVFQPNFATNIPAPPILSHADPYWIVQSGFQAPNLPYYSGNTTDWGVTLSATNTVASLQSGIHNLFGLPYETGYMLDGIDQVNGSTGLPEFELIYQSLVPGGNVTAQSISDGHWFLGYAGWCLAPTLQSVNYYFAPLINPDANTLDLPGEYDPYGGSFFQPISLPIFDDFAVTNQTPPLIIGAVGQPMILGGWAKYSVQGSSPTKYAYLGQYFVTNAFLLNTNGTVTTNIAGILSPYGEFFPTQAGQAQLVTMPDIDTGMQGTCTVSIVSLNVDANHDGTMDLSYFGQDQTSPSKPYVFWCNNNFDRTHYVDGSDVEQDDVPQYDAGHFNLDPNDPDCNYTVGGTRVIPCTRDLEDFSRLWISGVTSNLLASLPYGSTVTLNWGDVASPNSSNPTIDLFQAADTDGGIGYLTNSAVAAVQTNNNQSWFIGRLAPGGSLQLNAIQFNNFWAGNYFIWCGVTNGSGQLSLTFKDGNGNVLGQASVYIQIVDIKQMYERWTVGDNGNNPPTSAAINAQEDGLGGYEAAFNYGPATTNTPYILFVHGWNMQIWEKDRYAETAFKRLWWQGYQGRFGEFRWPTEFAFPFGEFSPQAFDLRNFDNSESNAWASGVGLLNKLNDLNAEYPGQVYLMAHSLGNAVAGEALRLAGNNQVVNTYIAMQGAISAHTYDPNTAARIFSPSTPDDYAHYWTNGAPCYFNSSAGAETYVNFFNTNDYALHSSTFSWEVDQNAKPDNSITGYPGYHYNVSSLHPNGFYVQYGSGTNQFQNLNFPGDTYTIFAYCDQAQSYALGAQADVGGRFTTAKQVDLQTIWPTDTHPQGGYKEHVWHSAEFRSDAASRWNFWKTVLGNQGFNLK